MKKKTYKFLFLLCLSAWGLLTGCSGEQMLVSITDGYTETQLRAKAGITVEEALNAAEISVTRQDVVEPGLDTVLKQENSEITIQRYAKAEVITEEQTVTVELIGGTVQEALEEAGVKLMENDYVSHDLKTYVTDGMSVSVAHRLEVTLTMDGTTKTCLTQAHTVKEFLEEENVELDSLDRVRPGLSGSLSEGTDIVVQRVTTRELTVTEPIAFDTEVTYSSSMTVGTSRLITEGVNGKKRVTYRVTYVDGKEESREPIEEEILAEAVNQVVVQGSKPKRTIVSKERVEDCDGSGHGYYVITYSDGTVEYQDF